MLKSDDSTPSTVPEPVPAPALGDKANGGLTGSSGPSAARLGTLTWVLALTAGLAAGVIAWAIGEATIVPERGRMAMKGETVVPPPVLGMHNGVFSFGALGATLGFGMGLVGGLVGRSYVRACLAALVGTCLGGGAGVVMCWIFLPIFYSHLTDDNLTYSLMVHGGVWTALGGATGLAFALGLGEWRRMLRATVGGAVGGLLASVIYEIAGGIVSPFAMTNLPVSVTLESRLAARLLVATLIVVGVVLSARSGGEGQIRR